MADTDSVDQPETIAARLERHRALHLHNAVVDDLCQLHDQEHPDEDRQWFGNDVA